MSSALSFLLSVVIVETVPKVLLFSVTAVTSSFSLSFIPTIAIILSLNDVLFDCHSSFIVSGGLVALSPLLIGENFLVFSPCSSVFGIGVDSVVLQSTPSIL